MTKHNTQEDFLQISQWATGWSCSIPTIGNAKEFCEFRWKYYRASQTWYLKKLRPVLPNLKMPCPMILLLLRIVSEATKHPRCHFALSFLPRSTLVYDSAAITAHGSRPALKTGSSYVCVTPIIHLLTGIGPVYFCHKQKTHCLRLLHDREGSREQLWAWVLFALPCCCSGTGTWGFNPKHGQGCVGAHLLSLDPAAEPQPRFWCSCRKASIVLICNWKGRLYCMTQKWRWGRGLILWYLSTGKPGCQWKSLKNRYGSFIYAHDKLICTAPIWRVSSEHGQAQPYHTWPAPKPVWGTKQ